MDSKFRTGARIGLEEYMDDDRYIVDTLYVHTAPIEVDQEVELSNTLPMRNI